MDIDLDEVQTPTGRSWPGQDNTSTTDREIQGFYSYGIAAEVFAVVGVGAFLPVTLEQLARENGVLYSDRSTPCVSPSASAAHRLLSRDDRDPNQCVINPFGMEITTASFAMYTFSAAVLQATALVSFSSFADYGGNRKRLLLSFGTIGALASCSFIFVVPTVYLVGALLVIVGIACLGSSFVVLNSFLPLLAMNHPDAQNFAKDDLDGEVDPKSQSPELRISTAISSKAVGLGYAAAIFVQLIGIGILVMMKKLFGNAISSTLPFRMILLLAGLWWLAFMVPTALWLRERPGPPLQSLNPGARGRVWAFLFAVKFAWVSLWRTIKTAAKLKQMVIFLGAWFLLSDAQASVSGTAVLFARTELGIGSVGIAMISITVMISGVLGASLLPSLQRRMGWSNVQTIVACLFLMECIPLYGLLGYLPPVKALGVGGLQQWWEIYPCAFMFGAVMAGLSSYCRAVLGHLIPPGKETAFFGLFGVVDKGSSAVGPAVVGRIVDVTGNIRPSFIFLAIIVALPIPLIWMADVERGRGDARRMAGMKGEDIELGAGSGGRREEAEGLMRGRDENLFDVMDDSIDDDPRSSAR